MSQPSQDILAALEDFIAQLQGELAQHTQLRDEADGRIEVLLTEKGDAMAELSQHYLPDLSPPSVAATFREVRDDVQKCVQRRDRRIEQLRGKLTALGERVAELESVLAESTKALNEAVAVRERLEREVSQSLEGDEQFRELSTRVLQSEQELVTFERRVVEARLEAEEKLPAYKASRLFQHLHRRGFGTPAYRRRGLSRWLDRWIARKIGYARASKSFDFLNSVPDLMQSEVERRQVSLTEAVEALEKIEMEHWRRHGLDEATERGDRLGDARDALATSLEPLLEQRQKLSAELSSAEDTQGDFYQQAIDRLKKHLDSLAGGVLQRQAERTPEAADDRIVADISWLRDEVDKMHEQQRNASREIRAAQQHVEGMQYVLGRFRQSEFDSQRSRFAADLNMRKLFDRFTAGEINHIELWRELRREQKFDPTWVEKATQSTGDALASETGQSIISATAHIAATALAVMVQNKLQGRGGGVPQFGKRFTKGDGF